MQEQMAHKDVSEFRRAFKNQSPDQITQNKKTTETSLSGHSPVSNMKDYVDLNNVSKLLPAVLDRMTEMNRLDDFQGLLKAIGKGIRQNNIDFH